MGCLFWQMCRNVCIESLCPQNVEKKNEWILRVWWEISGQDISGGPETIHPTSSPCFQSHITGEGGCFVVYLSSL